MGVFHELAGDLTREQLNSDPYQCGARVGKAARERDPRSWPRKLALSIGIRSLSCARRSMSAARLGGVVVSRVTVYSSMVAILTFSTFLFMLTLTVT